MRCQVLTFANTRTACVRICIVAVCSPCARLAQPCQLRPMHPTECICHALRPHISHIITFSPSTPTPCLNVIISNLKLFKKKTAVSVKKRSFVVGHIGSDQRDATYKRWVSLFISVDYSKFERWQFMWTYRFFSFYAKVLMLTSEYSSLLHYNLIFTVWGLLTR